MAEIGIEEAAALYGVAPETIWLAVQQGQLAARIDPMGRYLVNIPPPAAPAATPQLAAPPAEYAAGYGAYATPQASHPEPAVERLRYELEYTRYLLAEVSHQRDQLEAQVTAQLHQLERAEEAQHELRVLIGSAMQPGDNALRQVDRPAGPQVGQPAKRRWWPF
jgi:hypothetical protein